MKALFQCGRNTRLAETGFAGDQDDLAVPRLGAFPAPHQQPDLLVAANQWAKRRPAQCLEPARDDARTQHLPGRHRRGEALDLDGAEIPVFEELADQPARYRANDDRVGLGQGLQTGGEVRCFADDRLLLRRAFADQIADHHQPGGDTDASSQLAGFDREATDTLDDSKPRADCMLRIVFVGSRVAEIDQDAVTHILGDKALEPGDHFSDGTVVSGDDLAQILGIEPRGKCGRADEIAEHHRQLPTLGFGCCRHGSTERGDAGQKLAAMADRHDADLLEILRCQLRQYLGIDRVVAKRCFVLLHADAVEPGCDVHARLPAAALAAQVYLTAIKSRGREISAAARRRGLRGA